MPIVVLQVVIFFNLCVWSHRNVGLLGIRGRVCGRISVFLFLRVTLNLCVVIVGVVSTFGFVGKFYNLCVLSACLVVLLIFLMYCRLGSKEILALFMRVVPMINILLLLCQRQHIRVFSGCQVLMIISVLWLTVVVLL